MISIRFLVFFWSQKEDRSNRLAAVTPLFSSPSAVKTLVKTAKFDKKPFLVVTGEKEELEKFVSKVERLDVTDWLALETWDEVKEKLAAVVPTFKGLSVSDISSEDEQAVFGDDDEVQVTAASYPEDLPLENQPLWDEVCQLYKAPMASRGKGLNKDQKVAMQRRLYSEVARRRGMVPWADLKKVHNDKRSELVKKLEEGEAKASALIDKLERHTKSSGLLKNAKTIKFYGAHQDHEGISSWHLVHEVVWTLTEQASWRELASYLMVKEAFLSVGPRLLTSKINQVTNLDVFGDDLDTKVTFYIVHVLTHDQLNSLIGCDVANPIKELNKLGKRWHEKGKIQ